MLIYIPKQSQRIFLPLTFYFLLYRSASCTRLALSILKGENDLPFYLDFNSNDRNADFSQMDRGAVFC